MALITLALTVVGLAFTFEATRYGKQSLELAEWTALKDYTEKCEEAKLSRMRSELFRSGSHLGLDLDRK